MQKFIITICLIVIAAVSFSKGIFPKQIKAAQKEVQLSFCDMLDSAINEQRIQFKNIKGRFYQQSSDTIFGYKSLINVDADSSDIILLRNKYFFRCYFGKPFQDSIQAATLCDSLKVKVYDCLSGWSYQNIIGDQLNLRYTCFAKNGSTVKVYYRKNSYYDSTYTVGIVVEGK